MATTSETTKEYVARHRFARITARKARLIADEIRGKGVNEALEILQFAPQRAAPMYLKVLRSAVANAAQEGDVNVNRLRISDARADDGPLLQGRMRWRAGPQGRAMPFRRTTSHLLVRVREEESAQGGRRPARKQAGASKSAPKEG